MAYKFQHSVDVQVSRKSAWHFWTNVANWVLDADIEWVTLDGPFQPGAKGTTKTRGADLVEWKIADVSEGESAVIEIPIPGARASFAWNFDELTKENTRLTQTITLSGEQAEVFATQLSEGFEQGIREGMKKLSTEMERSLDSG